MAIKILNPSLDTYTRSEVNTKLGSYYTKSEIDNKGFKKITWTTVTIAKSAWSDNTATVTVSGVTTSNIVDVSPSPDSRSDYNDADTYAYSQGENSLTFKCGTTPSTDLKVNVMIIS